MGYSGGYGGGEWVFRVQHFSKYGLVDVSDSDEEGAEVGVGVAGGQVRVGGSEILRDCCFGGV